ncbi:hypothetical protein ACQHIV_42305 (plasmid) [Kribbella sp. GL6]|uniref:hypothetical protein n=1 Tax=Kribbella sp. GL6 TaxID=3419765 RepID=UPI003D072819
MPASKRRKKAADKTRRERQAQHGSHQPERASSAAAGPPMPWFPMPDESGDLLHGATLIDPLSATVLQLAEAWGDLAQDAPTCRGPVLIHSTGAFECLTLCGTDDAAVLGTYHDVDRYTVPCDSALRWDFTIRRPCASCLGRGL